MVTITNDEVYDLATHLARMADSSNVAIPVASQAERDTLTLKEGLTVIRLDLGGLIEVYASAAWKGAGSTAITALGSGWSAVAGTAHTPRLYRQGQLVLCVGGLSIGSSGNITNMCTIPTEFRPVTTGTMFIGSAVTSGGASYELVLQNGVMSIPSGYSSGTFSANNSFPITSMWPLY